MVMAAGRWQEPEEDTVLQFRAAALAHIAGREADAEAALREAAAREGASADTWVGLAAGREASCHLGLSIQSRVARRSRTARPAARWSSRCCSSARRRPLPRAAKSLAHRPVYFPSDSIYEIHRGA